MKRYTIDDSIPWKKACQLMDELRHAGVSCGETQGGIAMYPENDEQVAAMKTITDRYGVTPEERGTTFEEMH